MFERDFTDFLRYLTIERGLSRNTADAYRRDLEDYAAWLTARSIDSFREVKRETIVNYLNFGHSERAMEPATLARRLVAIKMLYRHLEEEGLIKENPAAVLESPKLWRVLPDFLTVSEVNAFLNAWPEKGTALELRNRTMLELLYASGLRVSELTNLPLAAPDFDNHLVRVTGKGEKTRMVPVGEAALELLQRYLAEARPVLAAKNPASPFVFLSRNGRQLDRERVWAVVKEAAAGPESRKTSIRTRCGIRLRAICWPTARTSASFRRCWDMPISRRRRFTPMSMPRACGKPTGNSIRAADRRRPLRAAQSAKRLRNSSRLSLVTST